MRRWITSLVPTNPKPAPVEPPTPPMAGPSGQPAGIDHLMAQKRPTDEIVPADGEDPYNSLMPVRRLAAATPILLQAPLPLPVELGDAKAAATDTTTADDDDGLATASDPQAGEIPDEKPTPMAVDAAIKVPEAATGEAVDPPACAPAEDRDAAANDQDRTLEPVAPAPIEREEKVPPVRWDTLHAIAKKAMQQGDPAIAAQWWGLMRLAFPAMFYGYTEAALALAGLGRFDEGRRILDAAAAHIQEEPAIPVTRALLEAQAGDMDASLDGWRAAMALSTSQAWICGRLVEALEQQSRHDEADAVLGRTVHTPRFQHPALLAKALAVAVKRKDWAAVAERLVALGNVAPTDQILAIDLDKILVSIRNNTPSGLAGLIQARWVESVLASPTSEPYRLINQARLAQLCGRLTETMARLAALRPILPQTADVYLRTEAIFRDAGSLAADVILAEAKGHFSNDIDVWVRIGDITESRDDWAGAVAHWTTTGQAFPGHAYPGYRYQQAALRLQDEAPDAEAPGIVETMQPAGETDLRNLALAFESLGGTGVAGGCEFGGIQRAWGAEPLGLFRWATVSPAALIACLEHRLDGVGDEATTALSESKEGSPLLWEILDQRYGYEMHSFIPVATMVREQMMLTACKRMRYLSAKLLRDLQNLDKIFVFKLAGRRLEPDEVEGLSRAVAQYPGMRLLCVCPADPDHPAEEIDSPAPGLMVASMDFSAGHVWAQRTAAWEALCRRVAVEWQPALAVAADV